jgi:hypothetical protein
LVLEHKNVCCLTRAREAADVFCLVYEPAYKQWQH